MTGETIAQQNAYEQSRYEANEALRQQAIAGLSPEAKALLGMDPQQAGMDRIEAAARAASFQAYYANQGQSISSSDAFSMASQAKASEAANQQRQAYLATPQAAVTRAEDSAAVTRGINYGYDEDARPSFDERLAANLANPAYKDLTFTQIGRARELGVSPAQLQGEAWKTPSREAGVQSVIPLSSNDGFSGSGGASASPWQANLDKTALTLISNPSTQTETAENAAIQRFQRGDYWGAANASLKFGTGGLYYAFQAARSGSAPQATPSVTVTPVPEVSSPVLTPEQARELVTRNFRLMATLQGKSIGPYAPYPQPGGREGTVTLGEPYYERTTPKYQVIGNPALQDAIAAGRNVVEPAFAGGASIVKDTEGYPIVVMPEGYRNPYEGSVDLGAARRYQDEQVAKYESNVAKLEFGYSAANQQVESSNARWGAFESRWAPLIKDGVFTGTPEQYAAYTKTFESLKASTPDTGTLYAPLEAQQAGLNAQARNLNLGFASLNAAATSDYNARVSANTARTAAYEVAVAKDKAAQEAAENNIFSGQYYTSAFTKNLATPIESGARGVGETIPKILGVGDWKATPEGGTLSKAVGEGLYAASTVPTGYLKSGPAFIDFLSPAAGQVSTGLGISREAPLTSAQVEQYKFAGLVAGGTIVASKVIPQVALLAGVAKDARVAATATNAAVLLGVGGYVGLTEAQAAFSRGEPYYTAIPRGLAFGAGTVTLLDVSAKGASKFIAKADTAVRGVRDTYVQGSSSIIGEQGGTTIGEYATKGGGEFTPLGGDRVTLTSKGGGGFTSTAKEGGAAFQSSGAVTVEGTQAVQTGAAIKFIPGKGWVFIKSFTEAPLPSSAFGVTKYSDIALDETGARGAGRGITNVGGTPYATYDDLFVAQRKSGVGAPETWFNVEGKPGSTQSFLTKDVRYPEYTRGPLTRDIPSGVQPIPGEPGLGLVTPGSTRYYTSGSSAYARLYPTSQGGIWRTGWEALGVSDDVALGRVQLQGAGGPIDYLLDTSRVRGSATVDVPASMGAKGVNTGSLTPPQVESFVFQGADDVAAVAKPTQAPTLGGASFSSSSSPSGGGTAVKVVSLQSNAPAQQMAALVSKSAPYGSAELALKPAAQAYAAQAYVPAVMSVAAPVALASAYTTAPLATRTAPAYETSLAASVRATINTPAMEPLAYQTRAPAGYETRTAYASPLAVEYSPGYLTAPKTAFDNTARSGYETKVAAAYDIKAADATAVRFSEVTAAKSAFSEAITEANATPYPQPGFPSPATPIPPIPIIPGAPLPSSGSLGAFKVKPIRFSRLPVARRVAREDALADLVSKTRAEAVFKRPARSPRREVAVAYSKSSLGLRVPTYEETTGELGKALKAMRKKGRSWLK